MDRSKLPPAIQNVPLERLSSGALMLLNRDDNLVAPPQLLARQAPGATAAQTAAVALDPRVGEDVRLGNDPPQLPANMRAQAEPFIARSLNTDAVLAATFQEGRFATGGGAVDCGYSMSTNGGMTWTRALIPNLTQTSGGSYFRATDPVVAFDLSNNIYFSTDAATDPNFDTGVILVSKWSSATQSFGAPVVVYQPPDSTLFPDKEWTAVNTFAGTSTANRIVVTWTLFSNASANGAPILLSYSDNGGISWSPIHYVTATNASTQGSQPVFLPNGNLVVVYWNFGDTTTPGERLEAAISTDGGITFAAPHRITTAAEWNEPSIRTGSFLPAAVADRATGHIFVVYQTLLNGSPRIAFTKSTDGGFTWSAPFAISDNPAGLGVFNPAVNVAPGGETVTAVFYDHRNNPGSNTLVDMYMALSLDGGATWQPNIRLTDVSTDASLAPLTAQGYMLGDYLGVAEPRRTTVPAVPIWVDTRTGNPDPFVTRASAVFTYYLLFDSGTQQSALWYFRGPTFARATSGPTLPAGWMAVASADFNNDGQPDYVLFNPGTRQTAVWYLRNGSFIAGAYGPVLPSGWTIISAIDFNQDGKPDYVLFNAGTHQTAVWYLNGATIAATAYGPTLPGGWTLQGAADFDVNGKPDFVLFNASTRQSAIWYLNGASLAGAAYGPTLPAGWTLEGASDFDGNGRPDYVLFSPSTRQTAIWFLSGATFVSGAYGPTLPAGYELAAP